MIEILVVGFNSNKIQFKYKYFKVACRVQIWKKTFCQNSDKFCCSFIKNDIMFMYLLYIYKKPIILSLFKIDTLNFTMYILANLTCPLKTYVRLHNLISMNIFFNIKDHSFSLAFFFIIVKRKPKTNRLQKPFKNSGFFKSNFNEHFLHNKGL